MWALGCLLYEAATGEHLCQFNPITRDTPITERHPVMKSFVQQALSHELLDKPENSHLKDLLTSLLEMKPEDRPTAAEVMNHPYFNSQ